MIPKGQDSDSGAIARRLRTLRARADDRQQSFDEVFLRPSATGEDANATAAGGDVPPLLRAVAGWSWRLLVVVAAVALVGWVSWQLRLAVFPLFIALMLASLLAVPTMRLRRLGAPRALAAATTVVGLVALLLGVLAIIGGQVGSQFAEVGRSAQDGLEEVQVWLADGPLHLTETQVEDLGNRVGDWVEENQDTVTTGALQAATGAAEFLAGLALTLFSLFFFLYDGPRIWAWVVGLAPRAARYRFDHAGRLAFGSLVGYVRGTVLVATFDAVLITILLLILGIPLAVPLGVLVFLGAFVPLVGAFVTGALAVLVALVTDGPVAALVVLVGIIVIQQLEGHLFQPLVLGKMARLHPLAVVFPITVGALLAGILGAIVAVPIAAVVSTVGSYLASPDPDADTGDLDSIEPDVLAGTESSQATSTGDGNV
jgi:predicted PurR-regulated permease PerM